MIPLIIPLLFMAGVSVGVIICIVIVIYLFLHPEKAMKWAGIIAWLISFVWRKAEYVSIKMELQSKINSFVGSLESNTTIQFPRVSIKWEARGDSELVWEEDEVIIVMRDRKHKTKNFVHAAYFFTSEILLRKSKRHLSKTQKISLDLFATKKILEQESRAATEQFMADYFSPKIEEIDRIREFIGKYLKIDKKGVFFPVLIQELISLGNKVFLSKPTTEVIEEVNMLIDFLERFSQREDGDKRTPEEFIGRYSRCAIKIVASKSVRERGDTTGHRQRIAEAIRKGFENIYLIGNSDHNNKEFMRRVAKGTIQEFEYIQQVRDFEFMGQTKREGIIRNVPTFLVHLHNPNAVKFLFEETDTTTLSE